MCIRDRFKGEAPEPRPGLRSGHIPGSKNVPYTTLLNADGTMKSAPDLRAVFEAAGVNLSRPAITSCGSGVTAAIPVSYTHLDVYKRQAQRRL